MRTVFIMLDSLNRHFLNSYGFDKAITPNIDRLRERCLTFDSHYIGSAPCMPARREMMTGRLNFMETPWSPIMPWDDCLPTLLRGDGVYSHMVTDHYHYFHSGGEAYHTLFDTYEFFRGQESDAWRPINQTPQPDSLSHKNMRYLTANRENIDTEDDLSYPTPQCFASAIDFLRRNRDTDNWHLHLEAFDPHEPFVCPQKYLDMYGDNYDGKLFNWPDYEPVGEDVAAVEHIRRCYMATLTMADTWLGKLLDVMDEQDMWHDTALIFSTDHGHLLGEHGYWAKNYMLQYEELSHIPLMIYHPGYDNAGRRTKAITATIDLMPTILEMHGAQLPPHVQGRSLMHLLSSPEEEHHDAVLFGYFGMDINMYNGKYTYCRQPIEGSTVYNYTAMPRGFADFIDRKALASADMGVFLKSTYGIGHYRVKDRSVRHRDAEPFDPVYDIESDPFQTTPIHDPELEKKLTAKLIELMERYEAPPCQFERLGLIEN